jgi:hypothetical protein
VPCTSTPNSANLRIPPKRNLSVASVFLSTAQSATAFGDPMRGRARACRRSALTRGVRQMKSKRRQFRGGDERPSGNEQVRREIQSFLRALHSYPEQFSKDPRVTFEEHRSGLVQTVKAGQRRRA